tara:strand:+ start:3161 stop:4147 length:987 start_codon:yes stop_codon:yes gene_type:complete
MSKQSALYSERSAVAANLSLSSLGLADWSKDAVKKLQRKVGAKPVDGWFGPKSVKSFKAWKRQHEPEPVEPPFHPEDGDELKGGAVIGGKWFPAPAGLKYVSHKEPNGIPAQMNDTSKRKRKVTQFVLHRGWAGSYKAGRNFAAKTEATLDARGLSGTHSMDIDGTIYQHFDPADRRGRHATHHNVQSDSLDIGGPFNLKRKPAPGQTASAFRAAIGRKNDGKPPMARKYGSVRCWSLTPEQEAALILFIPWWCKLRGIPLTACEDWRTMRLGGAGRKDPVTDVVGLLAHAQISGPGRRVDGLLPLIVLKAAPTEIQWRTAEGFFDDV